MSKNRPTPQAKHSHPENAPAKELDTVVGDESIVGGVHDSEAKQNPADSITAADSNDTSNAQDAVVSAADSITGDDGPQVDPATSPTTTPDVDPVPPTPQAQTALSMVLVNVPKSFRLTMNDGRVIQVPGGVGHIPSEFVDHWWVKANGVKLVNLDTKAVPQ